MCAVAAITNFNMKLFSASWELFYVGYSICLLDRASVTCELVSLEQW